MNHPTLSTLIDKQISLRPSGAPGFPTALLSAWCQKRPEATAFIERHTAGWDALRERLSTLRLGPLLDEAGVTRAAFEEVLSRWHHSRNVISVLGADFSAPPLGTHATQAVLNLHLAAGAIGRKGAGILNLTGTPSSACVARFGLDPSRGPDELAGNAETDARWSKGWGFPVHCGQGLTAKQSFEAAHQGHLRALVCLGGMNPPSRLTEVTGPGPAIRLHLAQHLDLAMLLPAETTLVLPTLPAGLCHGATTYSSSFRFIQFHRVADPIHLGALPGWRWVGKLAERHLPNLSGHLAFSSTDAIRQELASLFASHLNVDSAAEPKWLQWESSVTGGVFKGCADLKATFRPVPALKAVRGHKQVAVHSLPETEQDEPVLLISEIDAQRLGLQVGDSLTLTTEHGQLTALVQLGAVRQGCVWVHLADRLDDPTLADTPGWRMAKLSVDEAAP